jgi:hypothetical protein
MIKMEAWQFLARLGLLINGKKIRKRNKYKIKQRI